MTRLAVPRQPGPSMKPISINWTMKRKATIINNNAMPKHFQPYRSRCARYTPCWDDLSSAQRALWQASRRHHSDGAWVSFRSFRITVNGLYYMENIVEVSYPDIAAYLLLFPNLNSRKTHIPESRKNEGVGNIPFNHCNQHGWHLVPLWEGQISRSLLRWWFPQCRGKVNWTESNTCTN